ncbi:MAG: DHH family phosphoesterase [Bacilli bacterium]|nr:DHH family phosphoesterase [Bacilli bacterium]
MNSLFEQLVKIINNYDKIVIMAHLKPDLDAFGSSLGLYEIIKSYQKDVAIFLDVQDEINSSVKEATGLLDNVKYISVNNYKDYISSNTLLIILDVHQQERLYYPNIIEEIKDVVIIDHHIKSKNYIRNTKIFYNDSLASSVTEIIVFCAKYLNCKLSSTTATIMLAGIETDTNDYNLKTTANTYLACSYLMEFGADNLTKQELLKETKEEYLKRADYIKSSFMINNYTAVCILNNKENAGEALSLVAEEMLKFENVTFAIAIGRLENKYIGISAKSIGDIDACKYMKMFNGGGHFNQAAAQVANGNIKNILDTIKKALEVEHESNIN